VLICIGKMSTNIFKPTGKQIGECPICGKSNGNCRFAHNPKYPHPVYLCMTYSQETPYESTSSDFVFIKTTKDGLWGIWKEKTPEIERNEKRSFSHLYPKENYQIFPSSTHPTTFNGSTFNKIAQEKNKQWRNFIKLDGFRLQQDEIKELHRRGLTHFNDIPFIRTYLGLGIPILTPEKNIIGYQVRILRGDCNYRYSWFSPKVSNKPLISELKICGQTPIAFFGKTTSDQVIICEGYLKAAVTSFLENETVIGIGSHANINTSYEILKHYLDQMPELNFIYIAPDKDFFTNDNVKNSIRKLYHQLQEDYPNHELNLLSWKFHELYDIDERPRDFPLKVLPTNYFFEETKIEPKNQINTGSKDIEIER